MNPWIVSLSEGVVAREDVGDKAWRLSSLSAAGLPVPDGFIVTRNAYRDLAASTAGGDSPSIAVDAKLAHHLQLAFDDHFEPETLVAVRSSAIGEDGDLTSFAGQHKTLYFVERDGLGDAVDAVWASVGDSAPYRQSHGIQAQPDMAVIVQTMVDARSSGVCFALDPLGDFAGSVVESVWGLGAALVDGRVSPDRFNISREHQIERRRIARKPLHVVRSGTASDRLDPVASEQQAQSSLADDEVIAIAKLTDRCSELAGSPQDVEWSIDAEGELQLLQSRPITAAMTPGTAVEGQWVAFKPILENFTDPLTPLTIDLAKRVLPASGRFIDGRFYLNARTLKAALPFKLRSKEWVDLLLLRRREPPPLHWPKALLTAIAVAALYPAWGSVARRTRNLPGAAFDRFETLCDEVVRDGRMPPPRALWRLFLGSAPWAPIGQLPFQANVSAGRYFLLVGVLRALIARWAPALDEADIARLTSVSEDVASAELINALSDLARVARASMSVSEALNAGSPGLPYSELASRLDGTPFAAEFECFLERYGHRGMSEVETMSPRWREQPAAVIALVRNLMTKAGATPLEPAAGTELTNQNHADRLTARDRLHQSLKHVWQRRIIDALLTSITDFVRLRENTRNAHIRTFDVLRKRILMIEQQLLARGALKCPDDIFFLTWIEIEQLLDTDWQWRDAEPVIAQRRQAHADALQRGPKLTYNVAGSGRRRRRSGQKAAARLSGQCASPGVAEGIARVVLRPGADTVIAPGEVLVAPYTDPSWTPLFPPAAAVVVEVGSYLSHAGTVAREFATPCVVDVTGATTQIRDGERLRVDATNGEVTRLDLMPSAGANLG